MLLTVLVVLALAGALLARAAMHHHRRALASVRAQQRLQRRWATESCRRVVLAHPEPILAASARPGEAVPVSMQQRIELSGTTYRLILSDEQAKVNLNTLLERHGPDGLAARVHALQPRSARRAHVELRPRQRGRRGRHAGGPAYQSLDQIFVVDHPRRLVAQGPHDPMPADRLTCWSDGQLNIKKADPTSLRVGLEGLIDDTDVGRLVAYRQDHPDCLVGEMLKALELEPARQRTLQRTVTDVSFCHSLWIIAETPTRRHYSLAVRRRRGSGPPGVSDWRFQW